MSGWPEVFGDSVHQPVRIVAVDAHRRRPADQRLRGDAARRRDLDQNLVFGQQPIPRPPPTTTAIALSALDPWQIPGYPSLAARRITKPTIGITVAGGNGDTVCVTADQPATNGRFE